MLPLRPELQLAVLLAPALSLLLKASKLDLRAERDGQLQGGGRGRGSRRDGTLTVQFNVVVSPSIYQITANNWADDCMALEWKQTRACLCRATIADG